MSLAPLILQAAIYGDAQLPSKQNSNNPRTGIYTQERLCVISPDFLNTLPLRICGPNSAGKLDQAHLNLFYESETFVEFSLSFRFVFLHSDFKFASHVKAAKSFQKQLEHDHPHVLDDDDDSRRTINENTSRLLHSLDKNGFAFYDKFLKRFLHENFKQLRVLDLSWNANYLSDEHLILLAESNPTFLEKSLQSLDLSGNAKVTPKGLGALVYQHQHSSTHFASNDDEAIQKNETKKVVFVSPRNHLCRLKSLRLQRCIWIDDIALRNSISKIPSLTFVDLSATSVSAEEFACLADLVFLTSLILDSCPRVDDLCFRKLKEAIFPDHHHLNHQNENNNDDSFHESKPTLAKNLQRLSLRYSTVITNETLKIISETFENLRELFFANCKQLSHVGLRYFCQTNSVCCDTIERLDVAVIDSASFFLFGPASNSASNNGNSNAEDKNSIITNDFLEEHLWKLSSRLQHLYLAGYRTISDSSFTNFLSRFSTVLLSSGTCPLKTLDIGNCKNLKEESLEAIGKYCPDLERLVVAGNAGIEKRSSLVVGYQDDEERERSVASFRMMVSGLKKLKHLDVTETLISDYCLKCLAENCMELSVLTMSMCVKVSDGGMIFLRHLKQLKHVHAFRCPLITARGIEVLQMCLPGIVVTGGAVATK